MASTITLVPDDLALGIVSFDVTREENHELTTTLTKNPVESGATVSDHAIHDPDMFTCVVAVTNTPIEPTPQGEGIYSSLTLVLPAYPPSEVRGAPASLPRTVTVQNFSVVGAADRIRRTLDTLDELRLGTKLLTVYTSKRVYQSMVLTKISLPVRLVSSCEFTLTFEKLVVVSTDQVTAPQPKEPRGAPMQTPGTPPNPLADGLDQAKQTINSFLGGDKSALRSLVVGLGGS